MQKQKSSQKEEGKESSYNFLHSGYVGGSLKRDRNYVCLNFIFIEVTLV